MNDSRNQDPSDISRDAWVLRSTPKALRPYGSLMRLDRPVGIWLLLIPCWWSVALAGGAFDVWYLYILFALGAVVMRGAGCTINDLVDRDIDAKVARTRDRPLACGDISVKAACVFLVVLLLSAFIILVQFNLFTVWLGVSSLFLVVLYPFMKRITFWPQAVLGLTFNWGALMGWAAIHGSLSIAPVFLYFAGVFWTLGYDTIYAHQDKADDAMIGIKSTALKFGSKTKIWLLGFYGLSILMLGQAIDSSALHGWAYMAILVGSLHLGWQVYRLDIDDPKVCLKLFKSNRDFGLIVFLGLLLGLVGPSF